MHRHLVSHYFEMTRVQHSTLNFKHDVTSSEFMADHLILAEDVTIRDLPCALILGCYTLHPMRCCSNIVDQSSFVAWQSCIV